MQTPRYHLRIIITFAVLISATSCTQVNPPTTQALTQTSTLPFRMAEAPTIQPGNATRTVMVKGVNRAYLLHTPPGLTHSQPVPVVFNFHGYHGTPEDAQRGTEFDHIADAEGFLMVYPKGTGTGTSESDLSWNAETCCGPAKTNNVDETAFIRQILSDLETMASVDTKRIYAVGFSNGAALVYRLGCDMSDTFAGIAPVAGFLMGSCQPEQPVSLLHVHGLADHTVPYDGGGNFIRGGFPPVEQGISTWATLNDCAGDAHVETKQATMTHRVYTSCNAGTAVELYTISGLGHDWPSIGGFSLSQLIWDFFAAHPKP